MPFKRPHPLQLSTKNGELSTRGGGWHSVMKMKRKQRGGSVRGGMLEPQEFGNQRELAVKNPLWKKSVYRRRTFLV